MKAITDSIHIVECLSRSDFGGGQTVVYGLVSGWRSIFPDEKISVILPSKGIYVNRFKELGINVHEMPLDHLSLITFIRMFILIRSLRPSVVHSHGKGAGLYARIIPRFYLSAKRIHTYHGFHIPGMKVAALIYRILESFLLRATDIVISISNSEALEIKRTFWKRVITCEVIENSVDCKALKQSMEGPMNPVIESFFKLNQGRFIVTMIARYDKVKNYPLALDSCSSVLRQNADCAFLFVGINKQDDQFIQLNKEFPNRICGIDVKSSTSALIERSHVILLTSHKEGLPIVIQEAFCFAKPAVATNVAGINELVINDFNGTLCSENPDEIAANILRLIQDKSYYRQLCFGASKTAEKYDFKQWVMKYHRIYCL